MWGHVTHFWNVGPPPNISGTVEASYNFSRWCGITEQLNETSICIWMGGMLMKENGLYVKIYKQFDLPSMQALGEGTLNHSGAHVSLFTKVLYGQQR